MENQDKIFNQFKTAAQKAETKDFPGMDKVWSRVDEKLDKKILAKKSDLWKKIAVAASVLLFVSVAYQFLKPENKVVIQKNEVVAADSTLVNLPKPISDKNQIVNSETIPPNIKKNAEEILNKQITGNQNIVVREEPLIKPIKAETESIQMNTLSENSKITPKYNYGFTSNNGSYNSGYGLKGRIFDAIGVHHTTQETVTDTVKPNLQGVPKKSPPLVVVNGKAVSDKMLWNQNDDEIESVVVLKEPLYVINGVYYSEKDLFGPEPTSPYAPLDKQEIKTVTILQDSEAIEKYGKRGEKGVVIITTKDGKPLIQK